MLVIRRRPGESFLIGDDVEIEVLDATSSQVKLGIRAPREISVLRKEIRVTSEQNRASAGQLDAAAMTRLRESFTASTPPRAPSSEPAHARHLNRP